MQYDENAEKYGYEGEMTPMKCDKLKPYTYDDMIDGDADTNIEYYPKSDADKVIARHKYKRCLAMARICRLRGRLFGACGLYEKELWALKWHRRWLELAEKFKPNNKE